MSGQTALDGVNVLDLSESIGGAYCTKLLADLGASVILVERPGSGHPLRGTLARSPKTLTSRAEACFSTTAPTRRASSATSNPKAVSAGFETSPRGPT